MKQLLPKKYEFSQDFCLFTHDLLAEMISFGEREGLFNHDFQFNKQDEINEFLKIDVIHQMKWLDDRGYKDDAKKIFIKQVFPALVADLCHFTFESLSCSAKGKLSVAFHLLRKPFKDNLFYLEWMLADFVDFFGRFHSDDINNIELNKSNINKREIISKALTQANYQGLIGSDFIYSIRYDKNANYGLEPMWQKATHLITSHPSYKTETANLNFIFSNIQDKQAQWQYYYNLVPILLFHSYLVCDALYQKIIPIDQNIAMSNTLRCYLGFIISSRNNLAFQSKKGFDEKFFTDLFGTKFQCTKCGQSNKYTIKHLETLFYKLSIKCNHCGEIIRLWSIKK